MERVLPHIPDTSYHSDQACLSGTRSVLLNDILEWTLEESGNPVFWLNAQAGAGKSTIAHTIAFQADKAGQLGACFFLHRDYADRRNPCLMITTLAFHLAHFNEQIARGIYAALEDNPDLGHSTAVHDLFHKLIVEPIAAATGLVGPILIVIDDLDALDTTARGRPSIREAFLNCLADASRSLPMSVKIFVTSRPEGDISQWLTCPSISKTALDLQSPETHKDIGTLTRHLMGKAHKRYSRLGDSWPGEKTIQDLIVHASGLFIWITVACNFILQWDPEGRLKLVLAGNPQGNAEADLDELYRKSLLHHVDAQGGSSSEFYNTFHQILGILAVLQNPLSSKTMDSLLRLHVHSEDIINSLHSFLQIGENSVVRPVHPSFLEFLSNKTRCQDDRLFVDKAHYHTQLAHCCLEHMQGLSRNICHLGDSSRFNGEIEDLEERVRVNIPEVLRYACNFWAEHLAHAAQSDKLYNLVSKFVFEHLLHWLEALSLLGSYDSAIHFLTKAREWSKVRAFDKFPTYQILMKCFDKFE
jgi:hypothetical protein